MVDGASPLTSKRIEELEQTRQWACVWIQRCITAPYPETFPLGSITLNSGRSPCILHSGDHRGGESTGFPSHPCVSQTIRRPPRSKGGLRMRPPAWDSASGRSGTSHGGSTARRTNIGNQRALGSSGTTMITARSSARTLWRRDSSRNTGGNA